MAGHDRSWSPVTLPAEFRPPAGAYSPAVRAGNLLFVSGQVCSPWPRQAACGASGRG
jgi:enamine deaminase RidA (YjgF/YER057c/UK114 family)